MPEINPNRDLTHEMKSWVPPQETMEEEDEKKRLNEAGGGIEVGEKYKTETKRGMPVGQRKTPGEVKRGAPEAKSRILNPEEKMLAEESDEEELVRGDLDPAAVVAAQKDVDEARARRRTEEAAAGWSPKNDSLETEPVVPKRAQTTVGLRKSVWQKLKDAFSGPRFTQSHKASVVEGRRSIQTPKSKTEPFRGGKQ